MDFLQKFQIEEIIARFREAWKVKNDQELAEKMEMENIRVDIDDRNESVSRKILDAEKILTYPFVWEGLKRALTSGKIEIESPYSEYGVNTITLKPEVIPLNVKVILVGPRDIYYLLEDMDSEFNEMFRVLADFDNHIKLTEDSIEQFVTLMVKQASDSGVLPLTQTAIVRLIEHSCRLSENQHRFLSVY